MKRLKAWAKTTLYNYLFVNQILLSNVVILKYISYAQNVICNNLDLYSKNIIKYFSDSMEENIIIFNIYGTFKYKYSLYNEWLTLFDLPVFCFVVSVYLTCSISNGLLANLDLWNLKINIKYQREASLSSYCSPLSYNIMVLYVGTNIPRNILSLWIWRQWVPPKC
jgi:hypothetical protein